MNKQLYDFVTQLHKESRYEDNVNHIEPYRMKFFLDQINQLPEGALILDCGARKAQLAKEIKQLKEVKNLDFISFDVDNWSAKHVKENYVIGDCEGYLPFRDQSFDCVVFAEIYEHLATPWRAVHEICRVLKPWGLFIGSTPNPSFIEHVEAELEHVKAFVSEQELLALLSFFANTWYTIEGQYWLFRGINYRAFQGGFS